MYAIYVDGQLLYSTAAPETDKLILSPKLSLDVNAAGSLTFVLLPGNRMHAGIQKMKSIITVKQDDEIIFRGRVLDDEKDFYNQKSVYCEGDRAFLLDSVQRPYEFSGKVRDLFRQYINIHNSQVDASKKFTVGTVDAVSDSETATISNRSHADTSGEIERKLLGAYGGYLRTRTVGNTTYIDWVKNYGGTSPQVIEFAVNLLDLKDKIDAGDVFTVLIPLGKTELTDEGEYGDPLNVASVNSGKDYIENAAGIEAFGKIWRTRMWSHVDDASTLMAKGRKYLETGIAVNTITLKAVDWHFVDPNTKRIKLGDKVRILTNPHGLDKTTICARMDVDLLNPENTDYTFGEKPRTLTDNVTDTANDVNDLTGGGSSGGWGGGGNSGSGVQDEIEWLRRWAKIFREESEAWMLLTTGEINDLEGRTSLAEIELNGVKSTIVAHTTTLDHLTGSVASAEVRLNGFEATLSMKVDKNSVVSAINLSPENITISSAKINLEGYVTASQLSAEIADLRLAFASRVETTQLIASQASISGDLSVTGDMRYASKLCNWASKSVVTGVTFPMLTFGTIKYMKPDGTEGSQTFVTGYHSAGSAPTSTLKYMSYVEQ